MKAGGGHKKTPHRCGVGGKNTSSLSLRVIPTNVDFVPLFWDRNPRAWAMHGVVKLTIPTEESTKNGLSTGAVTHSAARSAELLYLRGGKFDPLSRRSFISRAIFSSKRTIRA